MKTLLRKLARYFFAKQIRVYSVDCNLSDEIVVTSHIKDLSHEVRMDLVSKLVHKIYHDGLLDFEQRYDQKFLTTNIQCKIRII